MLSPVPLLHALLEIGHGAVTRLPLLRALLDVGHHATASLLTAYL
jgi:hypothetical protein